MLILGQGTVDSILSDSLSLRVRGNKLLGGGLCSANAFLVPNKSVSTNPLTQEFNL